MSSRPLLISDCDEVLLHMSQHFRAWLAEAHLIEYHMSGGDFATALRREDGSVLSHEEIWPLLSGFFDTEMHRQTLVPNAIEALGRIGEQADIVILTNLGDEHHEGRVEQLERHGIRHRVICNRGGKGPPVTTLAEEYRASVVAFVDDLAFHHDSVAKEAPAVWRLHMIAEPEIAPVVPPAPNAHARIDDWQQAADWILDRFRVGPAA